MLFKGAFGDWFSWQNTLQRAAPLMLTALCVALPARAGLVIIGGEGALVLGGLACAALPYALPLPGNVVGHRAAVHGRRGRRRARGSRWPAALRQYRGVNETISSLLLAYIAIALFKHLVEGPLRDPASLNKPSTRSLGETACDRRHRRLRRALGPGARRRRLPRPRRSWLRYTAVRLRGARGRRQPAHRAAGRACRRTG